MSASAAATRRTTPAAATGPVVLVSAGTDEALRREVASGLRPCPEYVRLESAHGARLLPRPALPGPAGASRPARAAAHVTRHLAAVRGASAVLSDGEHVGLPLILAMAATGTRTPHVMIGHHLSSRAKAHVLRRLPLLRLVDRVLVHSPAQQHFLLSELALDPGRVHLVPYGVDTAFWAAAAVPPQERPLVVSAGREHRDHATLARACADEPLRVVITDGSAHSPQALRRAPEVWPANVERRRVELAELRTLYAAAGVVVVPLLATDFQAGVTVVLEAMAMGRPVVVSETEGLAGLVEDGVTGRTVPVGDARALRAVLRELFADADQRARLGTAGRRLVEERYGVDAYAARLAEHLAAAAAGGQR